MASVATALNTSLSEDILNSYLGANITSVCPHGYTDADLNHCAHFVSHVMGVSSGSITCKGMGKSVQKDQPGACIRVHELFKACPTVGEYSLATAGQKTAGFFIFVTAKNVVNVATKTMSNVPKKHVGICFNGKVWHYSNTNDKVVTTTPEKFIHHYGGQSNGLFFGTFPATAAPMRFAGSDH